MRRREVGYRVWSLIAAAKRAHDAGFSPPSSYCQTLSRLPYATQAWTDSQRVRYSMLMLDAPNPAWNPESRDIQNWLYLTASREQLRGWAGWALEELLNLQALLEA